MNKGKELAKNTLILIIGKICTQFITFLLLPLYTNILSTNEYGIMDLVVTYVGLLAPVITLELEMGAFRFLLDCRNHEEAIKKVISNVVIVAIAMLTIAIPIILVVTSIIKFEYIILLIFLIVTTSLSGIFLQISRGLSNNVSYSIGCIISGGLNVVLNVLFLAILKTGIEGMFLSQIIANSMCILYLIIRLKLVSKIKISLLSKEQTKQLLKYSTPLILNSIIWWIISASDRTIITIFMNNSFNGIYAISNKFSNIVINLYNVYNMSWTESVSLHLKDKDDFINRTLQKSIKFFTSICALLISLMPIIFVVLINDNYSEAYNYIPILLIATLFNIFCSMFGALYIALKKSKNISITSFISGIINIGLNLLFIRKFGLYAAAFSTLIAFIVMAIYRYFDIKKEVKINIKIKFMIISILYYIFILICYYKNNMILTSISIISSLVFTVISNREFVKSLLLKLKFLT